MSQGTQRQPNAGVKAEPQAAPELPRAAPDLVEVAVVKGPPQILTYRASGPLPPLGSRVRVPLGRRMAIGFVVGHPTAPPVGVKTLKSASAPIDATTPLTPEVMALTRRVADYYMASVGAVLAAALPPVKKGGPARARQVRVASLTVPASVATKLAESLEARAPRQAEALAALVREGEVSTHRLPAGTAARLVAKGVVALSYRESRRTPLANRQAVRDAPGLELTPAQTAAVAEIAGAFGTFAPFLLHGVTGSGKTEVYLQAAEVAIAKGGQVLLLTPEIALASHLTVAARARFGDRVALLHSALSDGERRDEWERVRTGDAVDLVIGTRSAVFAPLTRLALIVVDEEHDGAYKQGETPRYHARDVAVMRAQMATIPVVLGSATPALETHTHACSGAYRYLTLPDRVAARVLPSVEVVDLTEVRPVLTGGVITQPLLDRLKATLERGEQALLFLNRRGFSPLLLCSACGHTWACRHCKVSLTYHRESRTLACHYCNGRWPVPDACDECGERRIKPIGSGTEGLLAEVAELLPDARVGRMDRDTTRTKNAHLKILAQVEAGEIDVLIGTQMIAKGHNLPGVTLVGVVCADQGIHVPDFRAGEICFSLLTQVAGRAGRGGKKGRVVLQTFNPDHPAIRHAVTHDYKLFAENELAMRTALAYPPAGRVVRLVLRDRSEKRLDAACLTLSRLLEKYTLSGGVEVLGPAPPPISKIRDNYRRHLLIKGPGVGPVRQTTHWLLAQIARADGLKNIRVDVDVDPQSLL